MTQKKLRALTDENLGGKLITEIKNIFTKKKIDIEIDELPEDLKGKNDIKVIEYALENEYNAIISKDDGLIKNFIRLASLRKKDDVVAYWFCQFNENGDKTYILCEVRKIGGWREKISKEYI